ncbi:DUF2141 domain-containing protein [Marispirochaeta sp.]|uniref:DUF2141 domain-containing protein n=1 Tax=Marispirochaeta sp. TaxID=2038653 RepID=UPI0029C7B4EA|nr:DUF2141 domain-containing protein [Marispirochaeta sp.]
MTFCKNSILFIVFLTAALTAVSAQEFTVSGDVLIGDTGTVSIFLVDLNSFNKPGASIRILEHHLTGEDLKKGSFSFSFTDIPEGEYGVRSFIDTNGNGKCDLGLFGPKEPWGMSWKTDKPFGKPKFSDMSFYVESDTYVKVIVD